jgi:putative photosynthetic complex assembly protein 2
VLEHGLPALFAVFVWWLSTGLILHLDGLRRETFRWSMAGATVLLVLAFLGLRALSEDRSVAGAYCGFSCALLAWAWIELGFLTGWITGPRKAPLPAGTTGWNRLRAAIEVILWHELAILGVGAALLAASWNATNQVGLWTFVVLWTMRTSAKFNVFLGVRNLGEDFLPDHLRYLGSYFARRPMNPLLPFSVGVPVGVCAWIVSQATAPGIEPFEAVGLTLVGTLLALAIVEHLFMVTPIPADLLWRWGLRSRDTVAPARRGWSGPLDEALATAIPLGGRLRARREIPGRRRRSATAVPTGQRGNT